MQGFEFRQPGESDLVLGPDAGDQNGNFVLVRAIESPFVERGEPFDNVHRMFGAFTGFIL